MKKNLRFGLVWVLLIFLALVLFTFLHECGHGFGAQLDGIHVSTGFNRVGAFGKIPSDPDFRSNQYIEGTSSSCDLLGPFTNWTFAIIFTILLITTKKTGSRKSLLYGACAIANALSRLLPMTWFFISALFHHVHIDDEVEWGARSIKSLNFPMLNDTFVNLAKTHPMLFLSDPLLYFWPLFSISISLICIILAYRQMYRQFGTYIAGTSSKILFALSPIIAIPFWLLLINTLDNLIRINW